MVLFQQNDDWLEHHDQATALRTFDTFTVCCWIRPEAGGTAPFPMAFNFADDLTSPTQQFFIAATSGVWLYAYTSSGGLELQVAATYSNDWRFISLTFSPGTTAGTTKVRVLVRLATNTTPEAWETDLTHDDQPLILNDSWSVHTLSTGQDAATFGYYGHLQHWKVWDIALTPEELWRESQVTMPMVNGDSLLAWNPVLLEVDSQFFRQQQGVAGGGGYAVGLNAQAEDTSNAPVTTRPTPGAVFLNAPNPNPTLSHGTLQLAADENLQGKLGLASRIGQGLAAFVGGLLVVAGTANPTLAGGVLGLVGNHLTAVVGAGAALTTGPLTLSGVLPAAATGAGAALTTGPLTLSGVLPAAATGAGAALTTGPLTLSGVLPAAATGAGAAIDAGVVLCRGETLAAAAGLVGALPPGDFVLSSEGLRAEGSAPTDIVEGFEATVTDDQPSVTVDAGPVAATASADPVSTVDANAVVATVNSADVAASTDDPPAVNVSC